MFKICLTEHLDALVGCFITFAVSPTTIAHNIFYTGLL